MEVAVSVAMGSLGPVLRKLQLLADECSRIKGVGKRVRLLRSELASMHALLRKVVAMEEGGLIDVQVKEWARDVREMAYDVEDCIDAFTCRREQLDSSSTSAQLSGRMKEFIGRCTRLVQAPRSWRQFADQVDDLQARLVEVAERRQRYKLDDLVWATSSSSTHTRVDPLLRALFADEEHLVGIDWAIDELACWLLEENRPVAKHRQVLSIVGLGGLGKTTLANKVYLKIRDRFLCTAFVSVSQKPNHKNIVGDCLIQLCDGKKFVEGIGEWDEKTIITKMREYLADKRYLIVIDDVWSTSAWDAIECAFPRNSYSSRIITTTRIKDVATCCSHMNGRVYDMKPLSYSHSKRLFLKRIFGSKECLIQLQEVMDEILKKCGGLPLAIISISSLLANKPAVKEEWEKVRNSIGSALERDKKLEGIQAILNLSYNDLPHHLKNCLLYLGVFPEDCNIERSRLVNRWIAEGFIPQERGQSLQDVAESYFYELINKSMLQPTDVGYDGKARACRVHDIMLEIIISKATEENFITIIGSQGFIPNPQYNIMRRLSVQEADKDAALVLGRNNVSHVRSLTAFGLVKFLPSLIQFEVLRVLDFEGCLGLEKYQLDNINRLTQLMYVSFRDTWISKVPSGIVKLHNLDTLDLRGTDIVELPTEIACLIKLQHLLIARSSIWLSTEYTRGLTKIPDGIGNMIKLQVLSGININMSSANLVQDLSKLQNLKELHVQLDAEGHDKNRTCEEEFLYSLCKLGSSKLQYLWIRSADSSPMEFLDSWSPLPCSMQRFRMTTSYYFPKMPRWIIPALTSLAYLNINLVEVKDEDLRILGELHALLYLELWFKTNQNGRLTIGFRHFQCLKEFIFIRRPFEFRGEGYVVFETGALPKLEKLQLPLSVSMAKASGFYIGIEKLPCLRYAEVTLGIVGASSYESEAARAAIWNEANANPNHPRVTIWS